MISLESVYALLVVVVLALIFVKVKRTECQYDAQRLRDVERIKDLEHELNALSNASMGVGRKALEQDSVITALETRIEEIQLNEPAKVSYKEAARLAEMGASIDELMAACGISRSEAELVQTLTLSSASSNQEREDIPLLKEQV